jgi:hypothetical protein
MSCYTIKTSVLEKSLEKRYVANILYVFVQDNSYKIAVDSKGKVLDLYRKLIEDGSYIVSDWIKYLTEKPVSIESIEVALDNIQCIEELFLMLCSKTKGGSKMIIDSHQEWKKYCYNSENIIEFENVPIKIFDKEEAIEELRNKGTFINASNSLIAVNQSTISKSKNNNNE